MSYSSEVLADSPTAYWQMNETSGTTITDSIGGVVLSAVGTPSLNQPSPSGSSVGIPDGVSYYNTATGPDHLKWVLDTAVAVEFIHRRASISASTSGVMGHRTSSSSNRYYSVFYINNFLNFDVGLNGATGSYRWTTTYAASNLNWHHYVFNHKANGDRELWVDGVMVDSVLAMKPVSGETGTATFRLGAPVAGSGAPGGLDEVAIYNGTYLTAARVKAHWLELLNSNTKGFMLNL